MTDFYNRLMQLCSDKGVTGHKMCKDLGISPNLMSELKYGKRKGLHSENAKKIAEYFSVSVSYLIGESDLAKKDEVTEEEELYELLMELKNRTEMRMLFNLTKDASKADVLRAVKIIKALREEDE